MSRTKMEREISDWRRFGDESLQVLQNILSQRVSYTMTEHRAAEIVSDNNRAIAIVASRLMEIRAEHMNKADAA